MDRGAWWATVHGVAKSWTQLSNWTTVTTVLFKGWISGYQKAHAYRFDPTFPMTPIVGFIWDEEPEAARGSR